MDDVLLISHRRSILQNYEPFQLAEKVSVSITLHRRLNARLGFDDDNDEICNFGSPSPVSSQEGSNYGDQVYAQNNECYPRVLSDGTEKDGGSKVQVKLDMYIET